MRILYEDSSLIFIDKPPGIVVQRGYDADEPVLLEKVASYLEEKNERPYLMQRLDRGTSGVIFFSKRSEINARLTRDFERKRIRKHYLAIARGPISQHQIIDAPLARIGPISFGVRRGGRRAITEVMPLAWSESASLLSLELKTGRTHQIRVHLAAIGHPLLGDWLYGERDEGRPMLHAATLEMEHPVERTALRIESPLPADFLNLLSRHRLIRPSAARRASAAGDEVTSGAVE